MCVVYIYIYISLLKWSPNGIVVNVLHCNIVVSEVEFQSRHYIHFWNNTFGTGMNLLILPAMGYIVPLLFFYKDGLGIK